MNSAFSSAALPRESQVAVGEKTSGMLLRTSDPCAPPFECAEGRGALSPGAPALVQCEGA
jgi:hypothetical protein